MNNTESAASTTFRLSTRDLTLIALMTAVTCILGPLSIPIPFSPVPVTFGNLAIFLSVYVLGTKKGLISYVVYFLLGLAGLPVFSNYSGGLGKVVGPTGGYMAGFIFMIFIAGIVIEHFHARKAPSIAGMVLGSLVCNLIGTVWLSSQLGISFVAGLGSGVIPYLPGDVAKIIAAAIIGPALRKAVKRL